MKSVVCAYVLLIFSCFAPLNAQITHTANGNVDENAQKVLKKALDKLNANAAVSFKVTVVNKDAQKKETLRQAVDVLYSKGKYRVTDANQILYCNGKSVWHWTKSTKEVVVSPVSESDDDLMNPAKLLANYSKNYRPKFIRVEEDGTAIIDLTPKHSRSFHKIRLFIVEKTGLLKKMEMHNYDSSRGEYTITNYKSAKATAADFMFDAASHKEVEVIDMR